MEQIMTRIFRQTIWNKQRNNWAQAGL